MKRLYSFSVTSTFTFILSILTILVIAVSAPGMVQAVLGPAPASSGDVQVGNSTQASGNRESVVNPAGLSDTGIFSTVGIGIASPTSPLHIYSTSSTQPEVIDLDGAQPITAQWNDYSNTGGAFSGSGFLGRFARGSKATPFAVTNGDRLGFNVFGGWVGSWVHSASIEAIVDSGGIGPSSLPTYLKFSTTPDGSTTRLERMRITQSGNVLIGTATPTTGKLDVLAAGSNWGVHGRGAVGVYGEDTSTYPAAGTGVYATSTGGNGVYGNSAHGKGVYGTTDNGTGVYGSTDFGGTAVFGIGNWTEGHLSDPKYGVFGYNSTSGPAVYAHNDSYAAYHNYGSYGYLADNDTGVFGHGNYTGVRGDGSQTGVSGSSDSGDGVYGYSYSRYGVSGNSTASYGVYGTSANWYAGWFDGRVKVNGSLATAYRLVSASDTATANDSIIAVDASGASRTITLPAAAGIAGRQYTVKKVDISGNAVTLDGNGSETIDGATTRSLSAQWKYVTIVSDGANWLVTANN